MPSQLEDRMPRLAWFFGATIIFAAVVSPQARQEPTASSQPTFRLGVDVVQVDVSVLDDKRRPVRDLTAADFTVLEDGKPRPVTVFNPIEIEEHPARVDGVAPWVRDVPPDVTTNDVKPEGRLIVIMFDWSIRADDQMLARKVATAAVDALGPADLAAVVFTSPSSNAGIPQNFTSDRARLLAAINRPFALALVEPCGILKDPRNDNCVMLKDPEGYESGGCLCGLCVLDTIARVADAVRDVPGRRKSVLFIGSYFRSSESLDGPSSLREVRRPRDPTSAVVGPPADRPGYCSARLTDAREKMVRATSLANLTVHVLDTVGIETQFNSPMGGRLTGQLERRDGLSVLADATGGRAIINTNAPETHVPEVFAESHSYYLLGFSPADPTPNGRYHKIEVKVDRHSVSVHTRAGYYAGETRAAGSKATAVSPAASAALDGILPRTDVPLRVNVAPFALPGKSEAAVAIVLNVQQEPSTRQNEPVKVLAAAFDRNGRSVATEEQTLAVASRSPGHGSTTYEVLSRLVLAPGRYEIRVAVDAGRDQRASVYTYVDVPDFFRQPLSLSGIVLAVSPPVAVAPADAFRDITPLIPTARRDIARTDRATVFLRIYQDAKATAGPATVTARITDSADRVVFDNVIQLAADRFTANHGAEYRLELPAERLTGGEYLLTVEAAQGTRVARRGLRFSMR
jgi:VWFA-related protein